MVGILTRVQAWSLVQRCLPTGRHSLRETLQDAGLKSKAERLRFREKIHERIKALGYALPDIEKMPNRPATTLAEVVTFLVARGIPSGKVVRRKPVLMVEIAPDIGRRPTLLPEIAPDVRPIRGTGRGKRNPVFAPELAPGIRPVGATGSGKGYVAIPIFFATDRQPIPDAGARTHFGGPSDPWKLTCGVCEVTIPDSHKKARLEEPFSWWIFHQKPNPKKHLTLQSVQTLADAVFFREVLRALNGSAKRDAFVFIHGYNVTFEEAALRTGQLCFDLKFRGAPIFYSWPSQGTLGGYSSDEDKAEWSFPHLQLFLDQLAARSGADRIHLIAHSMGSRVLTRALEKVAARNAGSPFTEIVLAAPDINASTFEELSATICRLGKQTTLYANSKDKALAASRKWHDSPRAGQSGRSLVVVDGVATIDATGVSSTFLGHSEFGGNRTVITDLEYLIRTSLSPDDRGLDSLTKRNRKYWYIPK
jgi:esterase/lipase superfamily enzyme